MRKIFLLLSILVFSCTLYAADTLRVLFIGNSYTAVQNLPQVVSKLATASGDSLYYQVSAPGGYTLEQHSTDNATLNYIAQGNWDYVVLQEQSQMPSFPDAQVASDVYPYARKLDSLIRHYTPCAKTVFYMTWGRKNGDAQNCAFFPPVCSYTGMDSLLQLRYTIMAEDNEGLISPVAKVWRHLRNNSPSLELYQSDESHPSAAGTYAAALSFYTLFFKKNPVSNSYNFILTGAEANAVKLAAKAIVYDSLDHWGRFYPMPAVDSVNITAQGNGTITCTGDNPRNVLGYVWDFGDGSALSYAAGPHHTYGTPGMYTVCLTVYGTCDSVTYCKNVTTGTVGIGVPDLGQHISVYPNPAGEELHLSGMEVPVWFELIHHTGRDMKQGRLKKGSDVIDLRRMPAGIYVLKIRYENGSRKVFKIIKT